MMVVTISVTPAEAGVQLLRFVGAATANKASAVMIYPEFRGWMPAFAGMTVERAVK